MTDLPTVQGRVFITGATGLVGSHLAALLRGQGVPVRMLARPTSDVSYLEAMGCEAVEGTLHDPADRFADMTEGCSAVVHAAAVTYSSLEWPEVRQINVEGTRRVFLGAMEAGVPRLVHLSSVAVYGDPGAVAGVQGLTEDISTDTPLRPWELYGRSKREGERIAIQTVQGSPASLAILRPSAVYGERDRLFTPLMGGWLRFPLQFVLGSGSAPLPAVYAGNLAHAIVSALTSPIPGGVRAYNVADDHPISQIEIYRALSAAMGRPFRPVKLPAPLVVAGARALERVGVRLPGAEELPISRAARYTAYPNPFSSERIRTELGWDPPISTEEGLERTARWWAETQG